jgi:hypothetical protein
MMLAGQRSQIADDSRPTPSRVPRASASTTEMAAALRVPITPGIRYSVHTSALRNGFHFAAVSWPFSSNFDSTNHSASRSTTMLATATAAYRRRARGPGASKRTLELIASPPGASTST